MRRLVLTLVACLGLVAAAPAAPLVAVTAIVAHPGLQAVVDGVRDGLAGAGYGGAITFVFEAADNDAATAAAIADRFVAEGADVIVPISTPSAQAAAAATRDIPVVFAAVTDPVAAGLVVSLDRPGGNVTGVSDMSPMQDHVALIQELTPGVRRIGVVFNPGEANSVSLVGHLEKVAAAVGLSVVTAPAGSAAAVAGATAGLLGKVDAVYVPTDNTVAAAFADVVAVCEANRLPLYAGDVTMVGRGALASIGSDYYDVGRQAGAMAARVLRGEPPGGMPVVFVTGTRLVISRGAAARMGVAIPPGLLARADQVLP